LETGVPLKELSNVDLHALVSLARRVAVDMKDVAPSDVLAFFSRLQQYVWCLPGLSDAILSLKAEWLWFKLGDEKGCEQLLTPLRARELSSVEFAPLLELYLDFFDLEPVTRKLTVVERILELHKKDVFPSAANLLHYAIVKGMLSLMLGDVDSLGKLIEDAARQHLTEVERSKSIYSRHVAAMTHEMLWRLKGEPDELGAAISLFHQILEVRDLTPRGSEQFHQSLGMLLLEGEAFAEAIDHLRLAGNSAGTLINLANAHARLGQLDTAEEVLIRVDRKNLAEALKLECVGIEVLVANARSDPERVEALIDTARSLELPDLYYQRTRDQLCIAMLNTIRNSEKTERRATEKKVTGILGWLRYIAQFVELKPNVAGIGLNLNRIFEESSSK
jgi:tetratricopeptide (TPR) repeat protein